MTSVPVATKRQLPRMAVQIPKRRRSRRGVPLRGLAPLLVALVLWQLLGTPSSVFFPTPSKWWSAISSVERAGHLWSSIEKTAVTFILGLAIATVIGAVLGILIGSIHWSDRALNPVLDYLRNLPVAALVPVAAIVLGTNSKMAVTIVAFSAVWPVLLNTRSGVRGLSPVLVSMVDNLGLRGWRRRGVLLGAALPDVFLGIRVAAPLALVVTLLAEFVTNLPGLGSLLLSAQQNFVSAEVYGLLVIAGLLALVVNGVLTVIESPIRRRHGLG